jgi:hypothetical protein
LMMTSGIAAAFCAGEAGRIYTQSG